MNYDGQLFIGLSCRWCGKSGDPDLFDSPENVATHFLLKHGAESEARKNYHLGDPVVEGSTLRLMADDLGLRWTGDQFVPEGQ